MAFGNLKVQDLIYEDASNNEVTVVLANLAPKANPTFTGTVAVPTATVGDNTTKAASTAFVVASFAPKNSPAFTGSATGVDLTLSGNLTVDGTTTTINTQTLDVEDKNVVIGKVSSPSDTTADGGGWTLKGATDKTFNWVNSTDAWTSSEHIQVASGKTFIGNLTGDVTGTIQTAAQANITSLGTLTSLGISGNLTVDSSTFYVDASNNRVLVGTTTEILDNSKLNIVGTKTASGGSIQNQLMIADATNYATAEVGGGIAFCARYHSNGSYAQMGNIQGIKETTGNANYAGALVFRTRTHGANNDERLRISSVGAIGIAGANYGASGQVLTSGGTGAAPTWTTPSAGADITSILKMTAL